MTGQREGDGPGGRPMDPDTWRTVERIFADAVTREGEDREAFLREACAGQRAVEEQVRALLGAHEADPGFLEEPLVDLSDGALGAELPRDEREAARAGPGDPGGPRGLGGAPAMDRSLGPYRIIRAIGRGGMGEVFLAKSDEGDFQQTVALKLIRRGMGTPDAIARFRRERRILARLRHPNIATLFGGGETEEGLPYVAMEFVDGVRIDRYCQDRALETDRRLRLFLQVCDAVQHAHQSLVLHRDLKPGNILVTHEGLPKLLDFGIAKLLDTSDDSTDDFETRTQARALTPEYAAPEQLRGEPVSTASDVYALGVLLYELLTGVRPWSSTRDTGANGAEADARRPGRAPAEDPSLRATPTRPSQAGTDPKLRRRLSGDLDTIVLRAIHEEPGRRYLSVEALAADIRRHLEGLPVLARPDTLGYRVGKFVRRHRAGVAAASIVGITVVAASIVIANQNRLLREESARVAAERDKAVGTQGFLLELFGTVGPEQSGEGDVTARALLDAQVERLDRYDDRPEFKAEIQYVLADGYQRMGLIDEAVPLAEAALDARLELLGEGHPDVARAQALLGWVLREQGRPDDAEAMLRASIETWRMVGDGSGAEMSKPLNDLGVLLNDRRRGDDAIEALEEALAIRRETSGATSAAVGITANNLSVALWGAGRREEAVPIMAESVDALEASFGADHQRVWVARGNLMVMRGATTEPGERVADWREFVARAERALGAVHRETAWGLANLGAAITEVADGSESMLEEAVLLLDSAVAMSETTSGPEHPTTAEFVVKHGKALFAAGRYEEVVEKHERALAIYSGLYGPDHANVANALRDLGKVWFELGDAQRADSLGLEAYTTYERTLGSAHPITLDQRVWVGERMLARGEGEAAATWASATAGAIRDATGLDEAVATELLARLGRIDGGIGPGP